MTECILTRPCIKCGATERCKRGRCKACVSERSKAWVIVNSERKKTRDAAYSAANKEKIKANKAAAYIKNKEKNKLKMAEYRAKNKDKARLASAAWYESNRDRAKALADAWRAANPEAHRIYKQNRKAKKVANGGVLSSGLSKKLFVLQKGRCACCAKPLGDKYDLDHIMPLALGGANSDDNIQLLRRECNRRKSAKHPVQYMQEKGCLL
jgi:5-methylcytosine-specific restriction endonuclease McrA